MTTSSSSVNIYGGSKILTKKHGHYWHKTSREEIPQFKTLEEEKAYWESKGPLGIEAQREEIREGILKTIHLHNYGTSDLQDERLTDEVIKYIHSVGCVIKVDRELPTCGIAKVLTGNAMAIGCPFIEAGYEAVEEI